MAKIKQPWGARLWSLASLRKVIKWLASLKLAVVVLLGLAGLAAVGTFVEAQYDARYAQKLVYHSIYMFGVLGLLAVNLIAVMVDRWPWRPHHASFVLAHIGILVLLAGAWITYKFGVDASITLTPGEPVNRLTLSSEELRVFVMYPDQKPIAIFGQEVDWIQNRPSVEHPFKIPIGKETLRVFEYHHFATSRVEVKAKTGKPYGPSMRFRLENAQVQVEEWVHVSGLKPYDEFDLGPAKVILINPAAQLSELRFSGPAVIVRSEGGPQLHKALVLGSADQNVAVAARQFVALNPQEPLATGWMNLKFSLVKLYEFADPQLVYQTAQTKTPLAAPAVRFRFRDSDYWVGLNSFVRLVVDDHMLYVSYANRHMPLDFSLTLKEFRLDRYMGTMRASSYASRVEVSDLGETLISMNEPLKHHGFTFYQASFTESRMGEPTASILSVNWDPGRMIKYLGSAILVLGVILLFWFKKQATRLVKASGIAVALLMFQIFADAGGSVATAWAAPTDAIRYLPVMDQGRIKPFDTLAREHLKLVYGRESFRSSTAEGADQGQRSASEVVLTWLLVPEFWEKEAIFRIENQAVRAALGLSDQILHYSFIETIENPKLKLLLADLASVRNRKEKLNPFYQSVQTLELQLATFQRVRSGEGIVLLPQADNTWLSLVDLDEASRQYFIGISQAFVATIKSSDGEALSAAVKSFRDYARKKYPEQYQDEWVDWEVHYNTLDPFQWSWVIYLASFILVALAVGFQSSYFYASGWAATIFGFLLHSYGFALRMILVDRPPVSNMYETVVWVAWGAVFFASILEAIYRSRWMLMVAHSVAVFCLVLTSMAPSILDESLQPLEPVLRSNFWLATHVLIITSSYAAFFLSFALGDFILIRQTLLGGMAASTVRELSQLIYRSIQIGVVLLAAGIILGGIWADYSWGRFWGWDPKETWALIALLGYLAILHARMTGWVKDFELACWSVVAFSLVIMAWYGVNYVLGAGLHTYGFGAGGVEYVSAFVVLHWGLVVGAAIFRRRELVL